MRVTLVLVLALAWLGCSLTPAVCQTMGSGPMVMASAQPDANILELEKAASTPYAGTAWSVFNHRGSGLFVLLWGLTALIAGLQYPRRTWVRFVPPLTLFGMVEFLILRNDPMTWPLGPIGFWLSMRSTEVFQHRVFIAIILAMAIIELLRAADRLPPLLYRYAIPAVALVASVLILFHQHGALPMQQGMDPMSGSMTMSGPQAQSMAASMALIKRQHALFAIFGAGFVVTKLLADTGRLPGRLGAMLWPLFAMAVGLALINYTE